MDVVFSFICIHECMNVQSRGCIHGVRDCLAVRAFNESVRSHECRTELVDSSGAVHIYIHLSLNTRMHCIGLPIPTWRISQQPPHTCPLPIHKYTCCVSVMRCLHLGHSRFAEGPLISRPAHSPHRHKWRHGMRGMLLSLSMHTSHFKCSPSSLVAKGALLLDGGELGCWCCWVLVAFIVSLAAAVSARSPSVWPRGLAAPAADRAGPPDARCHPPNTSSSSSSGIAPPYCALSSACAGRLGEWSGSQSGGGRAEGGRHWHVMATGAAVIAVARC